MKRENQRPEASLGTTLRVLRGHLSQKEAARVTGLDQATWSLYENDLRVPQAQNLEKILVGLGWTRAEYEELRFALSRWERLGGKTGSGPWHRIASNTHRREYLVRRLTGSLEVILLMLLESLQPKEGPENGLLPDRPGDS